MLKDTLAKANTSVKLIKLDFKDAAIHKPVDLDLGFAVKFDLNSLKEKNDIECMKLLLSKSNAFRKAAKEKEKLISDLDNQRLELIKKRDALI